MRIIAGKHRSRKLYTLEGDTTRPTLDKVKEAVFSSINNKLYEDSKLLDLFGGSGAISLEAYSRGVNNIVINDSNIKAINIIKKNIDMINANDSIKVYSKDYMTLINELKQDNIKFDIIYLDPPFNNNYFNNILESLDDSILNDNAIIIVESNSKEILNEEYTSIYKSKEKKYGSCKITYYKRR